MLNPNLLCRPYRPIVILVVEDNGADGKIKMTKIACLKLDNS